MDRVYNAEVLADTGCNVMSAVDSHFVRQQCREPAEEYVSSSEAHGPMVSSAAITGIGDGVWASIRTLLPALALVLVVGTTTIGWTPTALVRMLLLKLVPVTVPVMAVLPIRLNGMVTAH